ncbi:NnrU family protein [Tateyamaria pelophila]|uniref:NnrU family protein n=1 Tax=Tateyamaria pelophila TaxID=328415 RepID=UPI001CBEB5D0|nr:NnrU family protein [Tateyamaria pelophila]
MTLLILGLILWILAHYFKRLAPDLRASLGNAGKGIIAILIVASIVAMVYGYKWAPFINVWYPPTFMVHINNLLMLIAFFVYGMSATTGRLRGKMRHPQLTAVKIWAVAHLLVNGDLASIILFGGLLAWAVGSVILINRAEPDWQRPAPGPAKKDVILVVITLVMFSVVAAIHVWLGVWPFPG